MSLISWTLNDRRLGAKEALSSEEGEEEKQL